MPRGSKKLTRRGHETHRKIGGSNIQGINENILKLIHSITTSDWQKLKGMTTSFADRNVAARVLSYMGGEEVNCLSYG